jgi:hypothetical protein
MIGRRIGASCALVAGAVLAVACGGSVDAENAAADGGGPPVVDAAVDAAAASGCDRYFDAYTETIACGGVPLPSAELPRLRARWDETCASFLNLPGNATTAAYLTACAAATLAAPCAETFPAVCNTIPGTLPVGASCVSDSQCASTSCSFGASTVDDGGTPSSACGQCAPTLSVGESCAGANTTLSCNENSICEEPNGEPICVPFTYGAAGDACNQMGAECDATSFCNSSTSKCQAVGAVGASCTAASQCATGLTCISGSCAAISPTAPTMAVAGAACSDAVPCIVGTCSNTQGQSTGFCPSIVADGQPCPIDATATCDYLASCANGVCTLGGAETCE